MAIQTNFPTSIDAAPTDIASGSQIPSGDWNTYADAIVAVETKVGVTAAASGSLSYTVDNAAGLLQTHKTRHQAGGADVMSIQNLDGTLAAAQKWSVSVSGGTALAPRSQIDFVPTGSMAVSSWQSGNYHKVKVSASSVTSANVFSTAGTANYTPPAGCTRCTAVVWGAGGAGGRCAAGAGGGGGGGGSFAIVHVDLVGFVGNIVVTVGSGGPAVTVDDTDGAAGGNSSFGTYVTAYGGGGGAGVNSTTGGGGGGGAGTLGKGSSATTNAYAGGGRPNQPAIGASVDSYGMGGACGGGAAAVGAHSAMGGGGAGGGSPTTTAGTGGSSFGGGAGGGGANDTAAGAAAGWSPCWQGGAGGAGGGNGANGTAGTQPGGGGGGGEGTNSGAGADGMVIVFSY